ncbi:glycine oxidase ThiO [Oculatella sp. LEGE 06141]|uniref:glycine oxidase ThiO n=1 Tax=Oculatella sp. LEGE 06141 TaxID=1828648 RepID=UPI00187EFF5E|nr:glycine oxidase ThiO [Oculatella sp. LEGE 06141]
MSTTSDVLIVGGGIVGMAIAVELRLRGASVTLLSRDFQQAATHAAAGMLAPQAEAIASAPLQDLCLRSQTLYPEWIRKLEDTSGLLAHYWGCGIFAPVYQLPEPSSLATANPAARWLEREAIHLAQPGLSAEVMGGWWFPEDGQVDNRALANVLRVAAQTLGVAIEEGVAVESFQQQGGQVRSVRTATGDWQADHYVLATGAWSQALLPVPVQPRKGQMLSVRVPHGLAAELPLQRILFGEEIYIVPRRDGRIVIGATSESVGFTPYNTPGGIQSLLNRALRLYPCLQEWPIDECWWGFRPATPDELPILGSSLCDNLTLAVGHYRNGILLAPITAKLLGDRIYNRQTDPLLESFSWNRFFGTPTHSSSTSNHLTQTHSTQTHQTSVQMVQYQSESRSDIKVQPLTSATSATADQPLVIAGRQFRSRLMTGTGKYRNFDLMRQSIAASGSQIVTVAVRRVQTNAPGHEGLAEALDWSQIWMLPNTAGCQTAEEAVRVARLGREMAKLLGQEDNNFVKLEVIPDAKYLLPDPIGTLEAAEQLVKEGFAVLPYINADPLLAKRLEEVGCVTVMPLGSPIGSGQGIRNAANIEIIIENAGIPVVVDAGIGTPSEASEAMEMGADALLINTAIAQAKNPVLMGRAMGMAAEAGRLAYLAGRIPVKTYASASSPLTGTINS